MHRAQKLGVAALCALVLGFLVSRELFFRGDYVLGPLTLPSLRPTVVYKYISVDPSLHKFLKGELGVLAQSTKRIAVS